MANGVSHSPRRRAGRMAGYAAGRLVAPLWVIAALVTAFFLREARSLFVPIALALLAAYALYPVVLWVERFRIPRLASAAMVVGLIVGGFCSIGWALQDDFARGASQLPQQVRELRAELQSTTTAGLFARLREAAAEVQQTTAAIGGGTSGPADSGPDAGVVTGAAAQGSASAGTGADRTARAAGGSQRARMSPADHDAAEARASSDSSSSSIAGYLWQGSSGLLTLAGQITVIVFLVYFLLVGAEAWRARLVVLAGDMLSSRRTGTEVIDEINWQVQRFLIVRLITTAGVAVATWISLILLGAPQPALWGVAAGVFNWVPYFGPIIVSGGLAIVGLVAGGLSMALKLAAVALVITSLEGWIVTPPLLGRAARMNTLAIFLSLLFWSWVWGVWGTILAVPLMAMIKAVADHVERLDWLSSLLAED
jgi:predicted PurR-regulated permease PerM